MRAVSLVLVACAALVGFGAGCSECGQPGQYGDPCLVDSDCDRSQGLICPFGFCDYPPDGFILDSSVVLPECGNGILEPGEACDDGNLDDGDTCSSDCVQLYGLAVFTQIHSNQADILFVIDNSGSMCEEQYNLRASFQSFIDGLTALADVDFHIGAITTDTLDGTMCGQLQNVPHHTTTSPDCPSIPPAADCVTGLPIPLPKILTASTPELARVFGCIGDVGIEGFGGEAHLASIIRATSEPLISDPSANAGFLRPDSLLALIIVSDEDDCSRCEPGDFYCGFLPSITSNLDCAIYQNDLLTDMELLTDRVRLLRPEGRLFVATIMGLDADGTSQGPIIPDPSRPDELVPICSSANGSAAPAPRLENFTRSFEPYARLASICDEDFSDSMLEFGLAIGHELLSIVCLADPPCPGLMREEITVRATSPGGQVSVLPVTSYTLMPDVACTGGYALIFTSPPEEGSTSTILYPAINPEGLGCEGIGNL